MSSFSPHNNVIVPRRFDCKPGDIISEKYTLVSSLGQGAFGQVFKVEDKSGQVWALKLLRLWDVPSDIRQPLVERFEMEYKTGRINSPYLVHSIDFGFLNGNPFIVMEYCPGGDLASRIGDRSLQLGKVLYEILQGLKALHVNGKVHRDLKPENVLYKADGHVALTDFGISGDRNKRMTERNLFGKPNQIFGTYAYMPPEQVNRSAGNSTVLPTTDIFSFGVLAYQLITGKLPFGKLDDQNDLVYYQRKSKAGEWDRSALAGSPYLNMVSSCLEPNYKLRIKSVDDVLRSFPQSGISKEMPVQYQPCPPSTRNLRRPCIRITDGEDYGHEFFLDEISDATKKMIITAGRDDSNLIQLKDFSSFHTSRQHMTFERKPDGRYYLRDGQWIPEERIWKVSSNGTFINSIQVDENGIQLNDGDVISAGDIKMIFNFYHKQ